MNAIVFKNVYFSFNENPVLEKVNLEIEENGFYTIIGPNGGGKTTLLKLILGLLKPKSGKITVFGSEPSLQRAKIGYMPQHMLFDSKFPVSVLDVVLMGKLGNGTTWGPFKKVAKEKAFSILEILGLEDLWKRPFFSLSGGERQRVLIARALISDPLILLLDEPSANVDMAFEKDLYEFLYEKSKEIAVIIVTHDLGFVSKYTHQCICVNRYVTVHPLKAVTGEIINELYGRNTKIVKHGFSESS